MRKSLFSTLLLSALVTSASAQLRQTTVFIDNGSGSLASLVAAGLTGNRTITMPDATGILSLTTGGGATLFTGPTAARTFTLPDADATLVTSNTLDNNSLAASVTGLTVSSLAGGGQLLVQADNSGVLSANNTLAQDLDLGTHLIHNVGAPLADGDAVNRLFVASATSTSVTGTAGFIPLFTDVHVLGNSDLTDDLTTFGVGSNLTVTEATGNLSTNGTLTASSAPATTVPVLSATNSSTDAVSVGASIVVNANAGNANEGLTFNVGNALTAYDIVGTSGWQIDNAGNASFNTLALSGSPLTVNNGGTNANNLPGYGVLEMNSSGSTVTSNVLTDGEIIVGVTGAGALSTQVSGDGTLDNTGKLTITSYGGNNANAFDDMATQNSNSVNITGGSLTNVAVNFNVLGSHQGTQPTVIAGGTWAGHISGVAIAPNSTDAAGQITFTTDGSVTGDNSTYIEVDFNAATTPGPIVTLTAADDGAASEATGFFVVGTGGANGYFRIYIGTSWIDFAQPITLNYHVINIQ